MRLFWVGLCASLYGSAFAADEWLEVQSTHFTVISNARRSEAWTVADELERIRAVFRTALADGETDPTRRVVVFAVKDERSFRELIPGLGDLLPAGAFRETSDGPRIVLRLDAAGENRYTAIYHEYHHVLLRASAAQPLPSWVVEGLAEFWSQAIIGIDEVKLGSPHRAHLRFLQNERMMPLDELLSIYGFRHDGEPRAIRTLYAQSWALTHWLMLADGTGTGQAKLDRYLELVAGGRNSVEAFATLFGPLDEVEHELKLYVRESMFPAMRIATPEQSDERFAIRGLTDAESATIRGEFLVARGQSEAARRLLEEAVTLEPDSGDGAERVGVLAFENYEYDEATKWLDEAVRSGTATFLSYYYRAMIAKERGDDTMLVDDLERAIELNPEFAPALTELAAHYARDPERRERVRELAERALELTPDDRFALVQLGRTFVEMGRPDEARKVLERIRALPSAPGSKAITRALEEAIERHEAR